MQKTDRHNIILNVITGKPIRRQDELAKLLRLNGFNVTQASVSRDLDELGIVKVDGIYTIPAPVNEVSGIGIKSLAASGENMLVARCSSGLASAVAVQIDAASITEIVGTIAGDDTIFIAVKDSKSQRNVTKKLREIFNF